MAVVPKLRYIYFDMASSRGEAARILLNINKIPFEDVRVQSKDWPEFKPKTPLGTIPILEVDGKQFSGSNNILRYIGKMSGDYPSNPLDQALVDEVLEGVEEAMQRLFVSGQETDPAKKLELRKKLNDETFPKWLGRLEKIHERDGSPIGGFFVGNKFTVADLKVALFVRYLRSGVLDGISPSITDPFARVTALAKKVFSDERIAAYTTRTNFKTYV